jgi:hypothetical protein
LQARLCRRDEVKKAGNRLWIVPTKEGILGSNGMEEFGLTDGGVRCTLYALQEFKSFGGSLLEEVAPCLPQQSHVSHLWLGSIDTACLLEGRQCLREVRLVDVALPKQEPRRAEGRIIFCLSLLSDGSWITSPPRLSGRLTL